MRSFIICIYPQVSLATSNKGELGGRGMCTYGRGEKSIKVLVGKPKVKRPLGRPRRRWEDWVSIDLGENGWSVN
jgi:hypothetical protein